LEAENVEINDPVPKAKEIIIKTKAAQYVVLIYIIMTGMKQL
jgi:hypothetical protein